MFLKAVALLLAVFLTVGRTGIMGGPREVDENREDVQNALKFAVTQHNKASNDVFLSQVSRVIKAQTQVVSGTNYIFNVEMVRTNCKKGGVENECAAHSDPEMAKPHECNLNVWSQPWTGLIKLTKNTC
ncbi:cystatin-like [Clarias gariepinus]|uniref:cystatin-like n=1 Tax=Clarias gariepinus TaxID=13013 RepID=UPI00234D9031|nr:cystatin-like [Clarias gariepinus]